MWNNAKILIFIVILIVIGMLQYLNYRNSEIRKIDIEKVDTVIIEEFSNNILFIKNNKKYA